MYITGFCYVHITTSLIYHCFFTLNLGLLVTFDFFLHWLWKRNNSNNNSFHCQHFVEKENYTKHNILALYSQYNSTINEIKERYKQGTWAEVESLMLTVDTCLTISSTSRRPGRQFTQLFSDVDAAFATCLSNHSVSTSSPSTISEQLLSSKCITLRLQGQKVH